MLRSDKVEFPGAWGAELAGRLDWPLGPPRAFALFAHCFTCSKDVLASARISQGLAARGIAVLRFDFTGLGHSGGEFASTGFSSNVEDLVAAADFLRARHEPPRILIGHSLGGAAALAAAGRVTECVAVATVGAPFDPGQVVNLFAGGVPRIDAQGESQVRLAGRTFTVRKQFLDDVAGRSLQAAVRGLRKALLVLHSPVDEVVAVDNARRIFEAALHPKSFVSLDGADHLLTRREDAAYVAELLSAWAARYLNEPPLAVPEAEAGTVVVTGAGDRPGESHYAHVVSAHGHLLRADEPVSSGGTDTGPGPYDLLLASLGTCTAMTLRTYAEKKSWPLSNAHVTLRHNKVHAEDCADCETKAGKIDVLERVIRLEGPLSDEQKARLMEIADKCPVHRTLMSEIKIPTRLAEG